VEEYNKLNINVHNIFCFELTQVVVGNGDDDVGNDDVGVGNDDDDENELENKKN
jgi:hypothetical protein